MSTVVQQLLVWCMSWRATTYSKVEESTLAKAKSRCGVWVGGRTLVVVLRYSL